VEARRKLKQDVRTYLEEREREEDEKVATREAHEHARARDAQEHEEELNYMRKIMYENKTELDRMKITVQELQEEIKRLLKENESLSKSITTKSTSNHQYNVTRTPEFKTISLKAFIRGSPVNKETYDEDPRAFRDTGMYEIMSLAVAVHIAEKLLTHFIAFKTYCPSLPSQIMSEQPQIC
jgi:hypothetical protein